MITIHRMLAPTDFSDHAKHVLRYAADLARLYHAELHVLHVVVPSERAVVVPTVETPAGISGAVLAQVDEAAEAAARTALEAEARALSDEYDVVPISSVRAGLPWHAIAEYAAEQRIDLIVIGTHGRGMLKRVILGSTSKAVLEHVACPVLMVPIGSSSLTSAAPAAADTEATAN